MCSTESEKDPQKMAMVYMNGLTRAFKWNLAQLDSGKKCLRRFPECNCRRHRVAGIILIRCIVSSGASLRVFALPCTAHELRYFRKSKDVEYFLDKELLPKLPILGFCENLSTCAKTLAEDLAGRFQFSTLFHDMGERTHALVLYLNLRIDSDVEEGSASENPPGLMEMANAEQIEKYLKMLSLEKYPEMRWLDIMHVDSGGVEEVKAAFEITKVKKNVGCGEDDEICPICLEEFYGSSGVDVARTCCSHMFHDLCIRTWLLDKGCCPLCKFSFNINI